MISSMLRTVSAPALPADDDPHVLIVVKDVRARFSLASRLLEGGFRVTSCGTYGMVEVLLDSAVDYDLLVTAQSFDEMAQFGAPQLARSMQPDLPILLLEADAAHGAGLVHAVQRAITRWPLRERPERRIH